MYCFQSFFLIWKPENLVGHPQNLVGCLQNLVGCPQNLVGHPQNLVGWGRVCGQLVLTQSQTQAMGYTQTHILDIENVAKP